MPQMNMFCSFQELGSWLGVTLSLERAIMAPSLNTARSTVRSVGKYLQSSSFRRLADRLDNEGMQAMVRIYTLCVTI